jgi:hypothetical protein
MIKRLKRKRCVEVVTMVTKNLASNSEQIPRLKPAHPKKRQVSPFSCERLKPGSAK